MEGNKVAEYDRKDRQRLETTINKVDKLLTNQSTILVVQCSGVGSFQFQKIRKILRGEAEFIRGKVVSIFSTLDLAKIKFKLSQIFYYFH
jgi:hypothetical protein